MAYDMKGRGVPLVFIHQAATDRRVWQRQHASLSGQYLTITVDVLGHGALGWPLEEMSIGRAAAHVQRLLERVVPGEAFLIGVSMGAAIAMRCARNAPSLVQGLILVSPWFRIGEYTKSLIERLFRLAESGNMKAHTELLLRYVFPPAYLERHVSEVERLRAIVMAQDSKTVAYAWAACLSSDVEDHLEEIRTPSLVIAGLDDLFTPPYLAREVAEGLFQVELEIWSATGHFPFLEDFWRFNRRLEAYIRRHFARASSE
jgi:pimeloyl-ACP methyl ester carboxylesterase